MSSVSDVGGDTDGPVELDPVDVGCIGGGGSGGNGVPGSDPCLPLLPPLLRPPLSAVAAALAAAAPDLDRYKERTVEAERWLVTPWTTNHGRRDVAAASARLEASMHSVRVMTSTKRCLA